MFTNNLTIVVFQWSPTDIECLCIPSQYTECWSTSVWFNAQMYYGNKLYFMFLYTNKNIDIKFRAHDALFGE